MPEPSERNALLPSTRRRDISAIIDDDADVIVTNEDHSTSSYREKFDHSSSSFRETLDHSASSIRETFSQAVEHVNEIFGDLADEMEEVREVVAEELHLADQGFNTLFLEMTPTRQFSILPEDIVQIAEEMPHIADIPASEADKPIMMQKPKSIPFYAYLLLAATVIALASFGPILTLQVGVSGSMKTVWRQLFTSFLFIPLVILEMRRGGLPQLNWTQWGVFALACIFSSGMGVGFVTALEYADGKKFACRLCFYVKRVDKL